jgi:phospholipase C
MTEGVKHLPALVFSLLALPTLACSTNAAVSSGSGGAGVKGGTGGGGGSFAGPPAWNRVVTPPADADAATQRLACAYKAGSLPAETQGAANPSGTAIPVNHILVLMQENRSFDHYFMKLPENGQTDVEVAPSTYTNPDGMGGTVAPFHDQTYCFADTDHDWGPSHQQYDNGMMDGFFTTNQGVGTAPPHPLTSSLSGARALFYYDNTDIPFYYWLANEFALADHYHCSLLGPTWPNRMYLYAASSRGVIDSTIGDFQVQAGACASDADCGGAVGACFSGSCQGTCHTDADCGQDAQLGACDVADGGACQPVGKTIFDYMEQRHLSWKVYAEGTPGWAIALTTWLQYRADHQLTIADYLADAAAGTLPDVAFIDPNLGDEVYNGDDEHPPGTPFVGQQFVASAIQALTTSPSWSSSALFLTYDEHGGLFDHVAPPAACPPDDFAPMVPAGSPPGAFDRYGVRVPMMVVSPFAKQHYVAHGVYDHTSILRFIQARFVLPAMTARDANAEAPWEMFDFANPPHATPPAITIPDVNEAALTACAQVWVP